MIWHESRKCCKWNCTNQLDVSQGMERWYVSGTVHCHALTVYNDQGQFVTNGAA